MITAAPTRRFETWSSRSRAMHDSTTPTATAKPIIAGEEDAPVQQHGPEGDGHDELDEDGAHGEELDRRPVEHGGEGGAAVVEDHDLVDHRQLEVRARVVDGDARVLGERDHEQPDDDQHHRGGGSLPRRADAGGEHARELERPAELHERHQAQEQRGLRQAREGHLAGRAHALERRARVERGGGREEAAQGEQVREQDEVAGEVHGRGPAAEGQDERRRRRRRQRSRRARRERPSSWSG